MYTMPLGSSSLQVPVVALGVMRMDALDESQALQVFRTAYEHGITMFDTADIYGGGVSSEKLGAAWKASGVQREQIILQTKAGIVLRDGHIVRYDFSADHIIAAVNDELRRLQTDYVDALLLHRPDTLADLVSLADAFDALYESGKVRHFGVSNMNPQQVELFATYIRQPLVANQLQFGLGHAGMVSQEFHVNMVHEGGVDRDGGLLAYSRLKNMTIQAWSPLQYGFFEGVFLGNPKFATLQTVLDRLAEQYGVSDAAIAIAWILRHPANMQALLGSMNPQRIADMAQAADVWLTGDEWYELYLAAGNDIP